MPYIKLAHIEDTVDFAEAAASMGWDETNYKEILGDIGDQEGYIVNYDRTRERVQGTRVEVEIFFTVGDECGNRWYSAGKEYAIVNAKGVWIEEIVVAEICC